MIEETQQHEELILDEHNPWPGLATFEERFADRFFGRSEEAVELLRLIDRSNVCVLYGKSGLGKSSLLRAGVYPPMRERRKSMLPVQIDLRFRRERAGEAVPLDDLVLQAKECIAKALITHGLVARAPSKEETLYEYFHDTEVLFDDEGDQAWRLVLVFDQFEEFFTQGQETDGLRERVRYFFQELAALAEHKHTPPVTQRFQANPKLEDHSDAYLRNYKIVIAVREDFLPQIDGMRELAMMPNLLNHTLHLEPLRRDQAMEVVMKPGGALVTRDVAERVVQFVESSRRHVATTAARGGVDPAILCLLCKELNEERKAANATQIKEEQIDKGKADEIIEHFYRKSMRHVSDPVQEWIEQKLVSEEGFRIPLPEGGALHTLKVDRKKSAAENEAMVAVDLKALTDPSCRVLVREFDESGMPWLRLGHDRLAEVAKRMRDGRAQRKAANAAMRKRGLMAVGMFLAVGFGAWMTWLYVRAEDSRSAAIKSEAKAQVSADAAKQSQQVAIKTQVASLLALGDQDGHSGRFGSALIQEAAAFKADPQSNGDAARAAGLRMVYQEWLLPAMPPITAPKPLIAAQESKFGDVLMIAGGSQILIFNEKHEQQRKYTTPAPVTAAALSADGLTVIAGLENGSLFSQRWLSDAKQLETKPNGSAVKFLRVSGDGKLVLAVWRGVTRAQLWSVTNEATEPLGELESWDVEDAEFSGDGRYLLAAYGRTVKIYDCRDASLIRMDYADSSGPIQFVRVCPNTKEFLKDRDSSKLDWVVYASASEDASVRIHMFDPDSKNVIVAQLQTSERGSGATALEWLPEGDALLVANNDGSVDLHTVAAALKSMSEALDRNKKESVANSQPSRIRDAGESPVVKMAFSPDGHRIALVARDGTLRTSIPMWKSPKHHFDIVDRPDKLPLNGQTLNMAFSKDNRRLLLATTDDVVQVYATQRHKALPSLISAGETISGLNYCETEKKLMMVAGGKLLGYDPVSLKLAKSMEVGSADFVAKPCGSKFAITASSLWSNSYLRVWDLEKANEFCPAQKHSSGILQMLWSDVVPRVLTQDNKGLHLWRMDEEKQELRTIGGATLDLPESFAGGVDQVLLAPSGDVIAAWHGKSLRAWFITAEKDQLAVDDWSELSPVSTGAFSGDGRQLVLGLRNGVLKVISLGGAVPGSEKKSAETKLFVPAHQILFARNGKRLAVSFDDDPQVRVYDPTTLRETISPIQHKEAVSSMVFSADGSMLATVSDQLIRLWSIETGRLVCPLLVCPSQPKELLFIGSDSQLVARFDKHLAIWNLPRLASGDVDWVPELASVYAGRELKEDGVPRPITDQAVRLMKAKAGETKSELQKWLLWPDDKLADRPVAPRALMTFQQYREALKKLADAGDGNAAVELRLLSTGFDALPKAPPPKK